MHREQLTDVLWPDLDTRGVANSLRQTLYVVRRTLAPDREAAARYLAFQGGQIALCPQGDVWVDVEAFEEAALYAQRSREPSAYEAAIDLYSGELLPEDRYEEWAEERR